MDERGMIRETLRVLRLDLEQRVMPCIDGADGRVAATMIRDMLGHLILWHEAGEGDSLPGIPGRAALDAAGQARVEDANQLPHLSDAAEIVDTDRRRLEEDRALLAEERLAGPRRLPDVEVEVSVAAAQRLIDAALGAGHAVMSAERVPGGYSKDTFFLDVRDHAGLLTQFVVRRDLPFGPAGTTVVDEFQLLQQVQARGLPVAAPVWCDTERLLGQPALLSRRVDGRSGLLPWSEDPAAASAVLTELAQVLARLHTIDPAAVGYAPAEDAEAQLRSYILDWQERWHRYRVHPSPTIAAGFAWLLANIPETKGRPAIVHGDINENNLMIEGERISAVLDWEFAHLGNPSEDIGYCRYFVEPLIPWDAFLRAYEAAGGSGYRPESARFFQLWRCVRNAVCCATSWRSFLSGAYPALKMAYQGIHLYHRFVHEAAILLEEKLACSDPTPAAQ